MANTPDKTPAPAATGSRLVDRDVVQVQFAIDDLIKHLGGFVRSDSCNGCNHCKAVAETQVPQAHK
jgi:hypothetical protein